MIQEMPEILKWKAGYAADPAINILLDKEKIAQIKVKEIELTIHDIETGLEVARLTRDAIKEKYHLK